MTRIISDTYMKGNKRIYGNDPKTEFNQRILAVNNMYGHLYNVGILEKVSFVFKDYEDATYFALDAKDLEPYRKEMSVAPVEGATLAVRHILDEPYTPCTYSGAIELGWTMSSYRSVDGIVGRSWECGLVSSLNTNGIYEIAKVRDEAGVKAAVLALYEQFDWNLTIPEQKQYEAAVKYFSQVVETNIENDYVKDHSRELIFCFENEKTISDFDFWTRYEVLLGQRISYDEYAAVDSLYDGDPHEIEETDASTISSLKEGLNNYRAGVAEETKRPSLSSQVDNAAARASGGTSRSQEKEKDPER